MAVSPILDEYKIFAKVPYPLIKFDKKHKDEVTRACTVNHIRDRPRLCAKMMSRTPKNDPGSILTTDEDSTTSKTAIDAVLSKSGDFNKMAKKIR